MLPVNVSFVAEICSSWDEDYGMRAVKTVIEAAGLNKRQYPEQSELGARSSERRKVLLIAKLCKCLRYLEIVVSMGEDT